MKPRRFLSTGLWLLIILLALSGCLDQPNLPEIPEASRAAVRDGVPAPLLYSALANGNLTLTWMWTDDEPWDLVSFDLTVAGEKMEGEWNIKPFAASGSGLYEIYAFTWHGDGFGETVPPVCVSVMAKNNSGKGTRTTTYHAKNCDPVTRPPAAMPPLLPQTISAGTGFVCGLSVTGAAYCWGHNDTGQLGDGTTTIRSTFWPVAGGHTFTQLSAHGWYPSLGHTAGHACALTPSGAAYCWGHNGSGQLGDGTTVDRHVPTPVSGGLQFIQIDVGLAYTCGVTITRDAYCWGHNAFGQLGDGTKTHRSTPQPVSGGLKFAQISAGGRQVLDMDSHTCGVTTTGAGYCWGSDQAGQVGNGLHFVWPEHVTAPAPVAGGLTFREISAGGSHSCGVTTSGLAYCWGSGWDGQVGSGSYSSPFFSPVAVSGGLAFARISAGHDHTCGLTPAGQAFCWGSDFAGQLGNGLRFTSAVPDAVETALRYTQISAGRELSCALTEAGVAYCWGDFPSSTTTPRRTPPATPLFTRLSAGERFTCGLSGGTAYCWGSNSAGQLGDGTTTPRLSPSAKVIVWPTFRS
jgi:alpha-tubulin suppressor-like RCC1 family protein